jgi:hypothetical protein
MISRWTASVVVVSILLLSRCSPAAEEDDLQQQHWLAVLRLKRSAGSVSRSAGIYTRQLYADALAQFVTRFPTHGRARVVYRSVELEFARQLCALGRYREAVPYYRHLIDTAPSSASVELRSELETALQRESVTAEKISTIKLRMSEDDVTAILGRPHPEWVKRVEKGSRRTECWYYPARGGGVAAVFFSGGRVYATDFPRS